MTTESRPQPIVNTQLVAQGIAIVLGLLVALGFITTGQSDALGEVGVYVIGGIPVVAGVIASFRAKAKVTPTADPRGDDGEPLVPTAVLREERVVAYGQGLDDATAVLNATLEAQREASGTPVTPDQIPAAGNALTEESATP